MPVDNKDKKEKINVLNEILEWLETLIFYCFIALLLLTFVFKLILVDGDSMKPTLENGQRILAYNLFYKPEQGDIIIFNNENPALEKVLIKRVIAVEGQTVDFDFEKGEVIVDGKVLDEPYIMELTRLREDFAGKVTVPDGCVFVLGDNRNNSTDSRSSYVGMVSEKAIIGKAVFRLFPFKFF